MSTKDEFVQKMHAKLDQWSAEIDALSAKADQAAQKAEAEARAAWQARCRPAVVTDREGLRRTQYAEPDCDLSRLNTAGGA